MKIGIRIRQNAWRSRLRYDANTIAAAQAGQHWEKIARTFHHRPGALEGYTPLQSASHSGLFTAYMLFDGFESLARTLLIGVFAYAALVFFLRISGRRTLSKMNSFDFVVTVALGSTLATVLLNKNVSLADGLVAFGLLIGLQFLVTWTSVRLQWVQRIITGDPIMLFYRGDFLPQSLRKARVTENEVRAAVRSAGVAHLENVGAVILETDGSFSVIRRMSDSNCTSLEGVKVPDLDDRSGRNPKPES